MGDGMLFDLFNFKEPYGISEVNIAQFPSIFFLYVAGVSILLEQFELTRFCWLIFMFDS